MSEINQNKYMGQQACSQKMISENTSKDKKEGKGANSTKK